ncbi:MAG: hypothetical protein ACI4RK_05300, partial [Oscillospiraceae bacterium]
SVIDKEEQRILDFYSEVGGSVAGKIEVIREQIHSITQTAIDENRSLLESELQNIQDLYNEIAHMTSMQEDIKTTATWERLKNGAYTYDSYAELADAIKDAQEQTQKTINEVEKTGYENAISKALYAEQSGVSKEQVEEIKQAEFTKIDESIKQIQDKSKKYQLEVISAWARGAFTGISKDMDGTEIGQKKLMQYFDLLLSKPDNISGLEEIAYALGDEEYWKETKDAFEIMENQFGIDFIDEWNRLNDEIGDSAEKNGEEYIDCLKMVFENSGIGVDTILPTLDSFKDYGTDSAKLATEAALGYSENLVIPIDFGVQVDTTEADNWLTEYKKELRGLTISPSVYAQQPSSYSALRNPLPYGDSEIAIKLYFEGENIETASQSYLFENTGRGKLYNIPITVNNGKGQ